jgi:hypothetical protein
MHEFWRYFLVYTVTSMAFFSLQSVWLLDESFYFNAYADKLSVDQIDTMVRLQQEWGWVTYLILPLVTLTKIVLVSSCLAVGLLLQAQPVVYRDLFLVAIKAEFVCLLVPATSLIWFLGFHSNYESSELSDFSPFSMLMFLNPDTVEPWLKYVINALSLVELFYILALTRGLSMQLACGSGMAFKVVSLSYGPGLILWVLFIGFLLATVTR